MKIANGVPWNPPRSGFVQSEVIIDGTGGPLPLDSDPAVTMVPETTNPLGPWTMYMVVKPDHLNTPYQDRLYLLRHITGTVWSVPQPLEFENPIADTNFVDWITTYDNFALAYVPQDHSVGGAGAPPSQIWPGRLFLMYAHQRPLEPDVTDVYVAVSNFNSQPGGLFQWMRYGLVANAWNHGFREDEPGPNKAGFFLLSEPGMDANPRAVYKTYQTGDCEDEDKQGGDIMLLPYADGVIGVDMYDHNDWEVLAWGVCGEIVGPRCNHRTGIGCDAQSRQDRLAELCGPEQFTMYPTPP